MRDTIATAPPSFAQQRLWFLDRLLPGTGMYNVPIALRLEGPLEADALAWALRRVVARHDALRAGFHVESGRPLLRIEAELPVDVPVDDLSGLPAGERRTRARALVEETAWTPFALDRPPLLRARLLRLGAEDHVLVLAL